MTVDETPAGDGVPRSGLAEGMFRMVVIARFPHLDPPGGAVACEGWGDTALGPVVEVPRKRGSTPDRAAGTPLPTSRRRGRLTFPIRSTMLLAALAAGCWAAVWREEQKRAAEDAADRTRPDELALEPDASTGFSR